MEKAFTLIELLIVIAIIAILALIAVPNFLEAQVRAKVSRTKADMRSLATAIEAYYVDHNGYPLTDYPTSDVYWRRYSWFLTLEMVSPHPWYHYGFSRLTTPIGYITSFPVDPFSVGIQPTYAVTWRDLSYFFINFEGASKAWRRDMAKYNSWANPDFTGTNISDSLVSPAPVHLDGWGGNGNEPGRKFAATWALISAGPDRVTSNPPGGGAGSNYTVWLSGSDHWNQMRLGNARTYDPSNGTVSTGEIFRFSSGSPE